MKKYECDCDKGCVAPPLSHMENRDTRFFNMD